MTKTIWVLLVEYNDYDQHGAYFEAAFEEKPTIEQIKARLQEENNANDFTSWLNDVGEAHFFSNIDRKTNEYQWFFLEEHGI